MRRIEALDDPRPWERACAEGWEGVIAKRRDEHLLSRRIVGEVIDAVDLLE